MKNYISVNKMPKLFGEDDDNGSVDLQNEAIQKAIQEQVASQMSTMKSSYEEQISKLTNHAETIKNEKRDLKSKFEQQQAERDEKNKKDKMDRGEFEDLLAGEKTKFEDIFNKQTAEKTELEKLLGESKAELNKFKMATSLKSAIAKSESFNVAATDDATELALRVFNSFDENNNPIIKDANGLVKNNDYNGQPYSVDDFMNEQQETRAFWFKPKQGSEMKGNQGATANAMTREQFLEKVANAGTPAEKQALRTAWASGQITKLK